MSYVEFIRDSFSELLSDGETHTFKEIVKYIEEKAKGTEHESRLDKRGYVSMCYPLLGHYGKFERVKYGVYRMKEKNLTDNWWKHTFFEREMRRIFGESEFLSADTKFTDKTMITKIDNSLIAKLEFKKFYYSDVYSGLQLYIINKNEGVIDSQSFKFGDIFGFSGRKDIGILQTNRNISWNKYLPNNRDYENIKNTIEDYIKMFSDQEMSDNVMTLGGG